MTSPTKRDLEKAVESLRPTASDVSRVDVPPAQARRIERAFSEYGADDPESLADLFVYGPSSEDDAELTEPEAAAMRSVEWREKYGEEPLWSERSEASR